MTWDGKVYLGQGIEPIEMDITTNEEYVSKTLTGKQYLAIARLPRHKVDLPQGLDTQFTDEHVVEIGNRIMSLAVLQGFEGTVLARNYANEE